MAQAKVKSTGILPKVGVLECAKTDYLTFQANVLYAPGCEQSSKRGCLI